MRWRTRSSDDGLGGVRKTAPGMSVTFVLDPVLFGPVFHGLMFRLKARYDVSNALLSVLLFLPIFILMMTVLFHVLQFMIDDDVEFLTISLSDMFIPTYFGALISVLTVLLF